MEGARWDGGAGYIEESAVGETHVLMPVIWLDPIVKVLFYVDEMLLMKSCNFERAFKCTLCSIFIAECSLLSGVNKIFHLFFACILSLTQLLVAEYFFLFLCHTSKLPRGCSYFFVNSIKTDSIKIHAQMGFYKSRGSFVSYIILKD